MTKLGIKLYSHSYSIYKNKKEIVSHFILPHFYKDRSLVIFSSNKPQSPCYGVELKILLFQPDAVLFFALSLWDKKVFTLSFIGFEYCND